MRMVTFAALVALLSPGMALAEDAYPAVKLVDTTKTVVGEDIRYPTTGAPKVHAVVVTIAPGTETVLHHHPAPMFAYILEGEVTVDYGASGKQTFGPGAGFVEAMNVSHKGLNTGTVPVRILAVSMGAEGTENVVVDKK
ncbi:cupin domain-containing protein [Magnetospirillum aberrantis]|uniref:Cupin domain-containing protein n=1 Tax=Magnetospirillum aberrantis SpK TaxID=908842 RepID=A0A7C9UZW8_9PROT|nr:cupin domain-containing protein [Magnetospirillum aberrantis]NFV80833.1 cupin domain-containing protein [Magnetospirillum aberrantis SpK]